MPLTRTLYLLDDTIIIGDEGVYRLHELTLEQARELVALYRESSSPIKSAVRTEEGAKAMSVFLGVDVELGTDATYQTPLSEALCHRDGSWYLLRAEAFGHAEQFGARCALAAVQDDLLKVMHRVKDFGLPTNLPSVPSR